VYSDLFFDALEEPNGRQIVEKRHFAEFEKFQLVRRWNRLGAETSFRLVNDL
jgi:hypothetical protein